MTAAEAAGRLEKAERLWTRLGEPEQALRCRVTRLEHADQTAAAAAVLEARGLEAAARAWPARATRGAGNAARRGASSNGAGGRRRGPVAGRGRSGGGGPLPGQAPAGPPPVRRRGSSTRYYPAGSPEAAPQLLPE